MAVGLGTRGLHPSPPLPWGSHALLSHHLKITIKLPPEGHEHQRPRHCQKPSGPGLSAEPAHPRRQLRPRCSPRPAVWAAMAPELGRPSGSALRGGSGHGGLSQLPEHMQPGLWSAPSMGRAATVLSSPHSMVLSWQGPEGAAAPGQP